ncbi:MAG: c-type cytochrome [Myxococcales bacterium]|nr:c-type cytochrome [Myxococcales bacterium]
MRVRATISFVAAAALAANLVACDKKTEGGTPAPSASAGAEGPALGAEAQAGKTIYDTQCQACHSIGAGDRAGPDLKDVSKRRQKDWLVKWIKDPVGMAKDDAVGKELLAKYKTQMPPLNLTDKQMNDVLAYIDTISAAGGLQVKQEPPVELTGADFERAKGIFFQRCAGCHGTLRAGATGPNIQPERTRKLGTATIKNTLMNGLPGGMPPWGKIGVLNDEEMTLMANYVQMPPPEPPAMPLEKIKGTHKVLVPVDQRPKKPETKRKWENFFGVVLRDAGQVAIIDGDTKEKLVIIPTGYAVHILRASVSGRYFYAVGRDGRVSLIDLWTETPTLVAQVQGCMEARSVDGSKAKGWEDKLVIEGCYWPPQYVVYDGLTLEPKAVQSVLMDAVDKTPLKENRVAAIVASHHEPLWIANLKESGFIALIDYSKPDFPMVEKLATQRFLHDGGFDHTKRFIMMAANMKNEMVVVDTKEKKFVTKFETGNKPHPGRGANWEDPKFGWVNATTHIGEPKLTIYGADPVKHPEHAWKVVREVKVGGPGSLFVKTHPKSPWVWMDSPLANKEEETRQICVYSKKEGKIEKCWTPMERGRSVHFEYNKDGTEVWLSGWDKKGALIIYNDKDLKEIKRIEEDWLVTPTGKFNLYNTAHDVY